LFKEICKSKEEFSQNDIHIFKDNAKHNSEMKSFGTDHFETNNKPYSIKKFTNLIDLKQNFFFEKNQTKPAQMLNWISNTNNNCKILYERGKTPEKSILIKNIIPHHTYIQQIPMIGDPKQVLDRSRHARQFSVHNPCYTKPNHSPYNINCPIINNMKFVKY